MSPEVNKRFYAFLNQTRQMDDKESIVLEISNGRVKSSKDLTDVEVKTYLDKLQKPRTNKNWTPKGGKGCDTMRKKVIAIFKGMGGTVEDAKSFAENMKGMNKKFNDLNTKELKIVIAAAEQKKTKNIQNFNQ